MLSVVMLSDIMLSVIMLSVVILSVVMLSVVMLSVVMLSVVAPYLFPLVINISYFDDIKLQRLPRLKTFWFQFQK